MNIVWLDTPACQNPLYVGGKAANLGRLAAQYPVPPGFCLAATPRDEQVLSPWLNAQLIDAYRQLAARCRSTNRRWLCAHRRWMKTARKLRSRVSMTVTSTSAVRKR